VPNSGCQSSLFSTCAQKPLIAAAAPEPVTRGLAYHACSAAEITASWEAGSSSLARAKRRIVARTRA
jgi:hypothetical protein